MFDLASPSAHSRSSRGESTNERARPRTTQRDLPALAERGRAPTAAEAGRAAGLRVADVHDGWRCLHEAHAIVLNPATIEIRMANPFSAVPTAYRVNVSERWWYANCAWDAFGICAALHADGRIESSCPDCGQPIAIEVRDQRPLGGGFFFHCLIPAAHWWDDIIFT